MLSAKNGHTNVVKFLLDQGANLTLKDRNGDTAMTIATENDQADIAMILQRAGANYVAKPEKEKKTEPIDDEEDEEVVLDDTPDVDDLVADEDDAPDQIEDDPD